MTRALAALAAALLLPACGDGSGKPFDADVDGRNPAGGGIGTGQPPFIRIISPGTGTTVPEGSTITIHAVADDPNAIIARVEFYDNNRLIGTRSSLPYTIPYGRLKAGTHLLCAVAVDIEGIAAASPPVTVFAVERDKGDKNGDGD